MPIYEITAEGTAREIYQVEAESKEQAREKFATASDLRGPLLTEVSGSEIVEIEVVE